MPSSGSTDRGSPAGLRTSQRSSLATPAPGGSPEGGRSRPSRAGGRRHGDIDPSIPRSDVPLLRAHLAGRIDVWAADRGTLRPMLDDADTLPDTCGNLWLRRSGADPWEYDVILMDIDSDAWAYKRDGSVTLPVAELFWERDGIRYLRPEVQLLHKAPGLRPQDQQDLDACLPLLGEEAAAWLRIALERAHPAHPWIRALGAR